MRSITSCLSLCLILLQTFLYCFAGSAAQAAEIKLPGGAGYRVSGPYASDNLQLFLIHGRSHDLGGKQIVTLDEALRQKQVIVKETGSVNQLTVENIGNACVFIQAGDIVKGGQQDRTLQSDLILKPHSGVVNIGAFCVEHGRWSQREGEAVHQFSTSVNGLASKDLKMAAKYHGSQQGVWNAVSKLQLQGATNGSIGVQEVQGKASPTSLQLTLENQNMKRLRRQHIDKLQALPAGKADVVGYAFAINGKVNSADIYASNALFQKLWPKLLDSTAMEAFAELKKDQKFKPASVDDVTKTIVEVEAAQPSTGTMRAAGAPGPVARPARLNAQFLQNAGIQRNARYSNYDAVMQVAPAAPSAPAPSTDSRVITRENSRAVMFETTGQDNQWLHRNYLTK